MGRDVKDMKVIMLKLKRVFFVIGKFLRDVKGELKKVAWPNKDELISYSSVVIVSILCVTVFIGVIDFLFSLLLRTILE